MQDKETTDKLRVERHLNFLQILKILFSVLKHKLI